MSFFPLGKMNKKRKLLEDEIQITTKDKSFTDLVNPEFEIPKDRSFIVKINGVAFKNFTKDFAKPVDFLFIETMYLVLIDLTRKFNVSIGYTISDKIFLIFNESPNKKHIFGGNVQKICSCLASYCSIRFHFHLQKIIREEWFSNLQNYRSENLNKMNESVDEHFKYFECKLLMLDIKNLKENKYIKLITKNLNGIQKDSTELSQNILNEKYINDIVKYGIFSKSIITQDVILKEVENAGVIDVNIEIELNKKTVKILTFIIKNESEVSKLFPKV